MPEKKIGLRVMDLKHGGGKLCHGCPDAKPGCKEACVVFLVATTPSGKLREYSFQSGQVNLKDVMEVKTDSMGLLEVMEKGGVVFRKVVLQSYHNYTSPLASHILDRLMHDGELNRRQLPTGDLRVTIIIEPMEPKKE